MNIYAVFDEKRGSMTSVHSDPWAARGEAMQRNAAAGVFDANRYAVYERAPAHDRRVSRGDDFSGDAWQSIGTRNLRWVAVDSHLRAEVAA